MSPKKKRQAEHRYQMTAWHWINSCQVEKKYYSLQISDEEAQDWFRSRLKADRTIHEALLEAVRGNRKITDYVGYV